MGLAVNTVARAYRELEQAEVVTTRSRAGTVIAAAGDNGRRRVAEAARVFADSVRANGLDPKEALTYVETALRLR
jgi:DNA-binding transcriptional regulator YhcF (GntR family)